MRTPHCYYIAYQAMGGRKQILWTIRFTLADAKEYVDERNSSQQQVRYWVVRAENPDAPPMPVYP